MRLTNFDNDQLKYKRIYRSRLHGVQISPYTFTPLWYGQMAYAPSLTCWIPMSLLSDQTSIQCENVTRRSMMVTFSRWLYGFMSNQSFHIWCNKSISTQFIPSDWIECSMCICCTVHMPLVPIHELRYKNGWTLRDFACVCCREMIMNFWSDKILIVLKRICKSLKVICSVTTYMSQWWPIHIYLK